MPLYDKEKLDNRGKVIVKCCYGAKCRFLHKGNYVLARTPSYVIDHMVEREIAQMVATMTTK